MVTESMTIQGLHIIFLALTPVKRWQAARHPFMSPASAAETWLTIFGVVVLIVSILLLFLIRAKNKHIAKLTAVKETLLKKIAMRWQEITAQRQEIIKLNRELIEVLENIIDAQPPEAELNPELIEVLENIADVKPPGAQIPGFNPQEMKALSELANRLR
jgi:hypothetical protein